MRRSMCVKFAVAGIFNLLLIASLLHAEADPKKGFPIDPEASCVTGECHVEAAKKKFVHEPAADGQTCTDCHTLEKTGFHSFTPVAEGAELCMECHDGMADKKFVHSIVEEGECLSCHDPHQSDNPKQLILPATSELCAECHDTDEFEGKFTHGPVLEGACLSCHDPHSSENSNQLVKPIPSVCFDCHMQEMKDPIGTPLSSTKDLYDDREAILHRPFVEGKCLSCHFPHKAKTYRLLKGSYPRSAYEQYSPEAYGLCFACHAALKDVMEKPRTLTETRFRNGNLNLHHRHVNKKKGRTCKSCHEHHGSKNPRLVKETFKIRKMELPIEFSLTETGGSCTPSCHMPVQYDRYRPVANTMKTTPRIGKDATPAELETSRKQDEKNWKGGIMRIGEGKGEQQ